MKIYLATSSSGVKKEQRKEMIKCCRPLYLLETFYSGEKEFININCIIRSIVNNFKYNIR